MTDTDPKELEFEFENDEENQADNEFVDLSDQTINTAKKQWTISVLWDKYKKGNIVLQPDFQRHFV